MATDGRDSAEQAQQRETVEQLYQAIHQLPKTDAALVLLYLDELSYREMAEVLGISESNVGVKLNRAKKALSALMNGMNPTMDPDKYQQAWQAQSSQTRVTVDADLLLKEVQRNQRDFRATIFRRDVRRSRRGTADAARVVLSWASRVSLPWTWYLTVPAIIWVVGFILVDRMRHQQKPSEPGEPLLECVKDSLTQVEHQIWLLRNVFWWYLLPFTISILAFFAHVTWLDV